MASYVRIALGAGSHTTSPPGRRDLDQLLPPAHTIHARRRALGLPGVPIMVLIGTGVHHTQRREVTAGLQLSKLTTRISPFVVPPLSAQYVALEVSLQVLLARPPSETPRPGRSVKV